jgi:hypothetical protein
MPSDYTLVYVSESNPGLEGFLYRADPLRIYMNVFYHVGYHISRLLGVDGSWVGYHLVYAVLWGVKGALVYWLCRLLDLNRVIAGAATAVALLHGSDLSIGLVGQINQYGIAFWSLLSLCLYLWFLRSSHWVRFASLAGAVLSSYFALWSQEATLFGLLAGPSLFFLLLRRRGDRTAFLGLLVVLLPPAVYAWQIFERLVVQPTGASFQEMVLRKDIGQLSAIVGDYLFLLRGLFNFPEWLSLKLGRAGQSWTSVYQLLMQTGSAAMLAVIIVTCAIFGRSIGDKSCTPRPVGSALTLSVTLFVIASAFLLPYLALNVRANGYFRTHILAAPYASIIIAIGVYAFSVALFTPMLRRIVFSTILCGFLVTGFAANAVSYSDYNRWWERIQAPMYRLLQSVPAVEDGTVIMLQGVPAGHHWGPDNFGFDYLLRLAYPHSKVAGSYTYQVDDISTAMLESVIKQGGKLISIGTKKILHPQNHVFLIEGRDVIAQDQRWPPLISKASIEEVIVLRWSDATSFEIVESTEDIDMAVAPQGGSYSPRQRIKPNLSGIAKRRFQYLLSPGRS